MNRLSTYLCVLCVILGVELCVSCSKEEDVPSDKISSKSNVELDKEDVYRVMHQMYYWYDAVPDLDLSDYSTVQELFSACLWTPERGGPDRWSFMLSESQYVAWTSYGITEGFGITFHRWHPSESIKEELRVGFVNDPSPCSVAGFRRGDRINSINGIEAADFLEGRADYKKELLKSQCVFGGIDVTGNLFMRSVDRGDVTVSSVITSKVISLPSKKVAYLAYKNFLSSSREKQYLLHLFDAFMRDSVRDFILDLRYNGGGDVMMAAELAGYLVPECSDGEVFSYLRHNSLMAPKWDKTIKINVTGPNLNLSRLFVIISPYTASASELLINSLRPFMEVKLIGSSTEGKPFGMWNIKVPSKSSGAFEGRWRIAPICFAVENKWGEGGFFDGFNPDYECFDDILHPLGESEQNVQAALYYIENGIFPAPQNEPQSSVWLKNAGYEEFLPVGFQREVSFW